MRAYLVRPSSRSPDRSDRGIRGIGIPISVHKSGMKRRGVYSAAMKRRMRALFNGGSENEERVIKAFEAAVIAEERENRAKENERKLAAKLSAKSEDKEFIETTKSRYGEGFMDEMMNDTSSYARDIVTIQKQAMIEPDFTNDCFYYNLAKPSVIPELAGEYVILYTRPLGTKLDFEEVPATYPSYTDNKFTIVTERPRANDRSTRAELYRQVLDAGSWAAGTLSIHGAETAFGCEELADNHHGQSHVATPVSISMVEIEDKHPRNPFADCVLKDTGATISFGMSVAGGTRDDHGKTNYFGFHFAKMQVVCYNKKTEELERRLLVGVKLPEPYDGNVSSAFILMQKFTSFRDMRILQGDPGAYSHAEWRKYDLSDNYREEAFIPGPRPRNLADLGLVGQFNANIIESRLLTSNDPIRELENLLIWVAQYVAKRARRPETRAVTEGRFYIESRLKIMIAEARVREQIDRRETLVPARQPKKTREREQTMKAKEATRHGGQERGRSMARWGKRHLADRTNRRLGDGLDMSLPILKKKGGRSRSLEL